MTKRTLDGIPPETKNLAGGNAWNKSAEERFTQLMHVGAIGNVFYMDKKELIEHAVRVIKEFCDENPRRAAEIAIEGRRKYYMRTLPIVAVSQLSTIQTDDGKKAFEDAFRSIIITPRDLDDFIEITMGYRGLGRKLKRAINAYIKEVIGDASRKQFYTIKYKEHLGKGITLAHTKPETKDEEILFKYIKDRDVDLTGYEQIQAYEEFKKNDTLTTDDYIEMIRKYRLEPQTVIGVRKPTPEVWEALAHEMSILQLIKNIATLERHIGAEKTLKIVKERVTIESLQKGRVIPFRLVQAYYAVQSEDIKSALCDVIDSYSAEYDFSSLGKVCIAPDVSGSMTYEVYGINVVPAKIAAMFTSVLAVGIKDSIILPWDSDVNKYEPVKRTSRVIIRDILRSGGGGTNMELPVRYMIKNKISVDTFILITDSEEWRSSWINAWREYKARVNENAQAILIRVDPYNTNPYSEEDAIAYNIKQIYGWSDDVFRVILPRVESDD